MTAANGPAPDPLERRTRDRTEGKTGSTVIVTGASGLLGSHLCARLRRDGLLVRALSRTPVVGDSVAWYRYEMPGEPPASAFDAPADVLVHCAYETRATDPRRALETNVEGARLLFTRGRERRIRKIVFISSLSAHPGAISAYGRSKLAIERLLDPARDVAVRPGLIVSDTGGGLYGRIASSVRRGRVVPLLYGGRQLIQTIHIDDLVEGIVRILDRDISGVVSIAEPAPVPLKRLYSEIASSAGIHAAFVPLPGTPAYLALRFLEVLGLRLPVTSENVLGLRALRAFDVRSDLERLDLHPRSMETSVRSTTLLNSTAAPDARRGPRSPSE